MSLWRQNRKSILCVGRILVNGRIFENIDIFGAFKLC